MADIKIGNKRTEIEMSDTSPKKPERRNTSVEFIPDESVEQILDVSQSQLTAPKKRKCQTK